MTFAPGLVLNERYEIRNALPETQGAGCYRALDLKLGRDVRVRSFPLPPPSEALRQFDQRTPALAGLTHPHIRIFQDVGTLRREGYTVCAWQEGRTLAELGTLPWSALQPWVDETLRVLRMAHARGLAHGRLDATCLLETPALGLLVQDFALCPEDAQGGSFQPADDLRALARIMAQALDGPPNPSFQGMLTALSDGVYPPTPAPPEAGPRSTRLPRNWILGGGLLLLTTAGGLGWLQYQRLHRPLSLRAQEARRLYLQGRHHWNRRNRDNLIKAQALLRQAIALDPTYAEAYLALAECQALAPAHGGATTEAAVREARETLRTLAKVAPDHPDGKLVEAYLLFRYEFRWKEAEALFRKGLEAEGPAKVDPTRLHWFGFFLSCLGHHEEAVLWLKRAVAQDPLNLQARTNLAVAEFWAGQSQEAYAEMQAIMELDPSFQSATDRLVGFYESDGDIPKALALRAEQLRRGGGQPREYAGCETGWKQRGREGYYTALLTLYRENAAQGGDPFFEALPLAALGRRDEAFEALDRALAFRSPFLIWAYQEPRLASLRDDPRYPAFLRHLNLP